jgi:hypothetical protein
MDSNHRPAAPKGPVLASLPVVQSFFWPISPQKNAPLCLSVAFPERRSIIGATLTPTSAVLIDAVVV